MNSRDFYIKSLYINLMEKIRMFRGFVDYFDYEVKKDRAAELSNRLETKFDEIAFYRHRHGGNFEIKLENLNEFYKTACYIMTDIYNTYQKSVMNYGEKKPRDYPIKKEKVDGLIESYGSPEPCGLNANTSPCNVSLMNELNQMSWNIRERIGKIIRMQSNDGRCEGFYPMPALDEILDKAIALTRVNRNLPEFKFNDECLKKLIKLLKRAARKSIELYDHLDMSVVPDNVLLFNLDILKYIPPKLYKPFGKMRSDGLKTYGEKKTAPLEKTIPDEARPDYDRIHYISTYLHQEIDRLIREHYQDVPGLIDIIVKKDRDIFKRRQIAYEEAVKSMKKVQRIFYHIIYNMPSPPKLLKTPVKRVKKGEFYNLRVRWREDSDSEWKYQKTCKKVINTELVKELLSRKPGKLHLIEADPLNLANKKNYNPNKPPLTTTALLGQITALKPYIASSCPVSPTITLQNNTALFMPETVLSQHHPGRHISIVKTGIKKHNFTNRRPLALKTNENGIATPADNRIYKIISPKLRPEPKTKRRNTPAIQVITDVLIAKYRKNLYRILKPQINALMSSTPMPEKKTNDRKISKYLTDRVEKIENAVKLDEYRLYQFETIFESYHTFKLTTDYDVFEKPSVKFQSYTPPAKKQDINMAKVLDFFNKLTANGENPNGIAIDNKLITAIDTILDNHQARLNLRPKPDYT